MPPSPLAVAKQIAHFTALGYPGAPSPQQVPMMVEAWRDDLRALTDADLAATCSAYRQSVDPADRFWPVPGRLLAHSPVGRLRARLGSEAEASEAWGYLDHRLRYLSALGGPTRGDRLRTLDMDDPFNDEALWTALDAIGIDQWRKGADDWTRKEWRTVYMDRRRLQAESPAKVQKMLSAPQIRGLLGVDK